MIQVENYTIIENKAEYEEWYDSEICYTRKKGACLLGKPTTFPAVFSIIQVWGLVLVGLRNCKNPLEK
jgi:hypothetical protein